jgi:hypothetical protein
MLYSECSAKTGVGIGQIFMSIIDALTKKEAPS